MEFKDWYEEKVIKPKQDWSRVSAAAKERKLLNKKSKRDILREERIQNLGGEAVEVTYGYPLSDEMRREREELEWDLKYPNRHKNKEKTGRTRIPKLKGAEREVIHYRRDLLQGAKHRASAYKLPFNLELEDVQIPKTCPVLGIELFWGDKLTGSNPTLDRLVPEKGYTKGNVEVISHKANRLKNNMSLEEVRRLLVYMEGKLATAQ